MSGSSKLRVTRRACDDRYRQMVPNDTILSLSRLPVTDLQPSELSEKMHSGSILKSHETKTKANVKNPARQKLDIVPYYHRHQKYSGYPNKWRRRYTSKSAIFATLTWTLTLTSDDLESHWWLKMSVDLHQYHISACGYIVFDCVRTYERRRTDGRKFFINCMSHLC